MGIIFNSCDKLIKEELLSFLENNKDKYFTIISNISDLKWIFEWDRLEFNEDVTILYYKKMYPEFEYPDGSIYTNDSFVINDGEIIRLSTEQEINRINTIANKYKKCTNKIYYKNNIPAIEEFLEKNKNKYMVVSSGDEKRKWIFDYNYVDYMVGPDCALFYKVMYPLHSYPDDSMLCEKNFMQVTDCDHIRLATESEIAQFNNILRIQNKKDEDSELILKAKIVKRIMNSNDVMKTLKEILNE